MEQPNPLPEGDVMEQIAAIPPVPEEKVSISLTDLKGLIKEAVQEATGALMEANQRLQEQVQKSSATDYAEGVPEHMRRADPAVDPSRMSVARSVTIATRPVQENPEQYANVVDPGGLYVNNAMKRDPDATD